MSAEMFSDLENMTLEQLQAELAASIPGAVGGGMAGQPPSPMIQPPSPGPMMPPAATPNPAMNAVLPGMPMGGGGGAPSPMMPMTPPTSNQFPMPQKPKQTMQPQDWLAMAALLYGGLAKNRGVLQGVGGYAAGRSRGMERQRQEWRGDVKEQRARKDIDRRTRQQMGQQELMQAKGQVFQRGMAREGREAAAKARLEERLHEFDIIEQQDKSRAAAAETQFGRDKTLLKLQDRLATAREKARDAYQKGRDEEGRKHDIAITKLRGQIDAREGALDRAFRRSEGARSRAAARGGRGTDGGGPGIPVEMQRYFALRESGQEQLNGKVTYKPDPLNPTGPPVETRVPGLAPGPERDRVQKSLDEANAQIALWERIQGQKQGTPGYRPLAANGGASQDLTKVPFATIDLDNPAELDPWVDANGTEAFMSGLKASGANPEEAMQEVMQYGARREQKGAGLLYPQG